MKKVIFSDEWGEIVEYKRYRDSRTGRLLKDRTRVKPRFKKVEIVQFRYLGGKTRYRDKRTGRILRDETKVKAKFREKERYGGKRFGEPIYKLTKKEIRKTTMPGGIADNDGSIKESLRDTNIFTQIHKAQSALVNLRGMLPNGETWRHQFTVDKFGDQNQSEQLVNAIYWELASFNLRTNYNIEHVRFKYTSPRDARKRDPLKAMQISVTLSK